MIGIIGRIRTCATVYGVIAVTATDGVVAGIARKAVIAFAARDRVIALSGIDRVIARARRDVVVRTIRAVDLVALRIGEGRAARTAGRRHQIAAARAFSLYFQLVNILEQHIEEARRRRRAA